MNKGLNFTAMLISILTTILLMTGESEARSCHISEVVPSYSLEGGGAVGNGGGTVVCRNADQSIKNIEVLDFFEARVLRGINADLSGFSGDWKQKAQAVIDRLGKQSQLRQKIYSMWLNTFLQESMVLTGISFNKVPDALNIGVPKGCEFEQAAVQITPRFSGDKRYYLNQELWEQMSESQKAGLVLHEIVYREALSYGHTDSVATRYFVGLISSAKIATLNFNQFIDSLVQVRFEQTDVQLKEPQLKGTKVEFDPRYWWRGEGADHEFPIQKIELENVIVSNIGMCSGDSCETFKRINLTDHSGAICNGVASIVLPGANKIEVADQEDTGIECDRKVDWFVGSDLQGDSSWEQFSLQAKHSLVSKIQNETYFGSKFDFKFNSQVNAFQVSQISTNSESNQLIEIRMAGTYQKSNETPRFSLWFKDGKLNTISKSGVIYNDGTIDATDFLVSVYFGSRKFSQLVTEKDYLSLILASGVSQLSSLNAIRSSGFMGMGVSCLNDPYSSTGKNCIQVLTADASMIRISNGEGYLYIRFQLSGTSSFSSIPIADGEYDFHPGTVMLKKITLRGDANLHRADGTNFYYKSGAILELDSNGRVTKVISQGNGH